MLMSKHGGTASSGTCECASGSFSNKEVFRLGGVASGLLPGASVVVQCATPRMLGNEQGAGVAVTRVRIQHNGPFSFPGRLAYGQNFAISLQRAPNATQRDLESAAGGHGADKVGEADEADEEARCAVGMGPLAMRGVRWWGPAYVNIQVRGASRSLPAHTNPCPPTPPPRTCGSAALLLPRLPLDAARVAVVAVRGAVCLPAAARERRIPPRLRPLLRRAATSRRGFLARRRAGGAARGGARGGCGCGCTR